VKKKLEKIKTLLGPGKKHQRATGYQDEICAEKGHYFGIAGNGGEAGMGHLA